MGSAPRTGPCNRTRFAAAQHLTLEHGHINTVRTRLYTVCAHYTRGCAAPLRTRSAALHSTTGFARATGRIYAHGAHERERRCMRFCVVPFRNASSRVGFVYRYALRLH